MSRVKRVQQASRRDFLKGIAVAGGATTAAVVAGGALASKQEVTGVDRSAEPTKGYRETPHIREYYRLARS